MRSARTDLVLAAGLGLLAAVLVAAVPHDVIAVRAPAMLVLVLLLPGYALTAAIFRAADARPAERVLLAVGLSIAATILCGLVLDLFGVRLNAPAWAASLGAVTIIAALVGQHRGNARTLGSLAPGLSGPETAALACAVLLAGAAGTLGLTTLDAPEETDGTSALFLVPAASDVVRFGVRSDELRTTDYLLDVRVDGRSPQRLGPFRLRPGETWRRSLSTGPGSPRVDAVLRLAGSPQREYRRVALRHERSAVVATVPRCKASHPLRNARGCYRLVLRGKRAYRFYSNGSKIRVRGRR